MDAKITNSISILHNGVESHTPISCPICNSTCRIIGINLIPNGVRITLKCPSHVDFDMVITTGLQVLEGDKLRPFAEAIRQNLLKQSSLKN